MKKIKLMLAGLATIAVVGGALAFKAKGSDIYCSTQRGGVANTTDSHYFITVLM